MWEMIGVFEYFFDFVFFLIWDDKGKDGAATTEVEEGVDAIAGEEGGEQASEDRQKLGFEEEERGRSSGQYKGRASKKLFSQAADSISQINQAYSVRRIQPHSDLYLHKQTGLMAYSVRSALIQTQ